MHKTVRHGIKEKRVYQRVRDYYYYYFNALLCVRGATPYGGSVAREFRVTRGKRVGVYYSTSSGFSKNDR